MGPSPQTVDRPLAVTRIRAQAPGFATRSWEHRAADALTSSMVLLPPGPEVSAARLEGPVLLVAGRLQRQALIGHGIPLGAWAQEQAELTSQYATSVTNSAQLANYHKALDRYWGVTYVRRQVAASS